MRRAGVGPVALLVVVVAFLCGAWAQASSDVASRSQRQPARTDAAAAAPSSSVDGGFILGLVDALLPNADNSDAARAASRAEDAAHKASVASQRVLDAIAAHRVDMMEESRLDAAAHRAQEDVLRQIREARDKQAKEHVQKQSELVQKKKDAETQEAADKKAMAEEQKTKRELAEKRRAELRAQEEKDKREKELQELRSKLSQTVAGIDKLTGRDAVLKREEEKKLREETMTAEQRRAEAELEAQRAKLRTQFKEELEKTQAERARGAAERAAQVEAIRKQMIQEGSTKAVEKIEVEKMLLQQQQRAEEESKQREKDVAATNKLLEDAKQNATSAMREKLEQKRELEQEAERQRLAAEQRLKQVAEADEKKAAEEKNKMERLVEESQKKEAEYRVKAEEGRVKLRDSKEKEQAAARAAADAERKAALDKFGEEEKKTEAAAESKQKQTAEEIEKAKAAAVQRVQAEDAEKKKAADERNEKAEQVQKQGRAEETEKAAKQEAEAKLEQGNKAAIKIKEEQSKESAAKSSQSDEQKTKSAKLEEEKEKAQMAKEAADKKAQEAEMKAKQATEVREKQLTQKSVEAAHKSDAAAEASAKQAQLKEAEVRSEAEQKALQAKQAEQRDKMELEARREADAKNKTREEGEKATAKIKAEEEEKQAKTKEAADKLLAEQDGKKEATAKRAKEEEQRKAQLVVEQASENKAKIAEAEAKRQQRDEAEQKTKKTEEEASKAKIAQQATEESNKQELKQKDVERKQEAEMAEQKAKEDDKIAKAKAAEAAKKQAEAEAKAKAEEEAARLAAELQAKNGVPLRLGSELEVFGDDYAVPVFKRVGKLCFVFGVAFAKNVRSTWATLPPQCRPQSRLVFKNHLPHMTIMRVDLLPDGRVLYVAGGESVTSGPVSLTPFIFMVSETDPRDVRMSASWTAYGEEYSDPVYQLQGDFCVVSGLARARSSSWSNPIAKLPSECAPVDGRLIFGTDYHEQQSRIDVLKDGSIVFVYAPNAGAHQWLSLDGIRFFLESASQGLELASGWVNHRGEYRIGSYHVDDAVCAVSGLLSGDHLGLITVLPEDCRPHQRQIFFVNQHQVSQRVDVLPNGKVVWIEGDRQHGWLSLDGISFLVKLQPQNQTRIVTLNYTQVQLPLESGWEAFNNGYRPPEAHVTGGVVMLSGLLKTTSSSGLRSPLSVLPGDCDGGSAFRTFNVFGGGAAVMRFDVRNNTLRFASGSLSNRWVSLDGIIFPKRSARLISVLLSSSYVNFGGAFQNASYFKQGDLCLVTGLVRTADGSVWRGANHIGSLPAECRPSDGRLIFAVNHDDVAHRVDMLVNGQLHWVAGERRYAHLSLDGIAFTAGPAHSPLQLHPPWRPYRHDYRAPSYSKVKSLCVLSGLATLDNENFHHILTLPDDCRPRERIVFGLSQHGSYSRVDALPDGRLLFVDGQARNIGWLSLDGVRFIDDEQPARRVPRYNETVGKSALIEPLNDSPDLEPFVGYAKPRFSVHGALCTLEGRFKASYLRHRVFATLPAECAPDSRLVMEQFLTDARVARVDVHPSGNVTWVAGSAVGTWFSFDGLQFPVRGTVMRPIELLDSWVGFNKDNYGNPSYVKQGAYCVLSGMLRPDNSQLDRWTSGLARLPAECTPQDGTLLMHVNQHEQSHRVDVQPSGSLVWVVGERHFAWLSLDGIAFFVNAEAQPLSLLSNWIPYNAFNHRGFRVPSFSKQGGFCALSGLMRNNGGEHIATLSAECRPRGRMSFAVNQHEVGNIVEVLPDGIVLFKDGPRRHGFLSLDGVRFMATTVAKVEEDESLVESKAGTAIALDQGVEPFHQNGGLYRNPLFTVWKKLCILSGVASAPNIRGRIGTLPEACRPQERHVFDTHNYLARTARVDVLANGDVRWIAGNSEGNWVSLDGVMFSTVTASEAMTLPLVSSLVAFESGYAEPTYFNQDDFCVVSGVVRTRHLGVFPSTSIGNLAQDCRPADGHLVFSVNHNEHTSTVYLFSSGLLAHKAGALLYPWLSLDGIAFFTHGGDALSVLNGYSTYGHGYRRPSVRKQGPFCAVSGLASGSSKGSVALLPDYCRPDERLIFNTNNHGNHVHFDVLPDGRIIWVEVDIAHGWISFDGIRFVTSERPRGSGSSDAVVSVAPVSTSPLALAEGITAYGRGYLVPSEHFSGGVCMLSGRVTGNDLRGVYAVLSERCRPRRRLVFDSHADIGGNLPTWRIDITVDGKVSFMATLASDAPRWVSLDGIMFPAPESRTIPVALHSGWEALSQGYTLPSYVKQGDVCILSGVARHTLSSPPGHIGTLPSECHPEGGQLIFSLSNNDVTWRVDVTTKGVLHWVAATASNRPLANFLSLSGLAFSTSRGRPVALASGWRNLDNGYRQPSFVVQGDLCILSGTVNRVSGSGATLARLPSECAPERTATFFVSHNDFVQELDVVPVSDQAEIVFVAGTQRYTWMSLDGIRYMRRKQ